MIRAAIFDMYETLVTLFAVPAYLSPRMAADAGLAEEDFRPLWQATEEDRTLGRVTAEEAVAGILRAFGCPGGERLKRVLEGRARFRREAFSHLHPQILPMLEVLKERGLRLALISNCHSDEAARIRESVLYPYFDAVCLSYEEKMKKPDPAIYLRCLDRLGLSAEECLYVGDGGSDELRAAKRVGMRPVQALWYLREGTPQPVGRLAEFVGAETPLRIPELIRALNEGTPRSGREGAPAEGYRLSPPKDGGG